MRAVRLVFFGLWLLPSLARTQTLASAEIGISAFRSLSPGRPATILRVTYQGEKAVAMGDALVVYSEPGHLPLIAHVNSTGAHPKRTELALLAAGALSIAAGSSTEFSHTITIPWDLLVGRELQEVAVVMRDGPKETVLSRVRVSGLPFEASSKFSLRFLGPGRLDYKPGGQWNHCGPLCGEICTDCQSAFFSCDLVNCDITCESF